MAITSGWGRGPWGSSVWGEGALIVASGVSASFTLGAVDAFIAAQPGRVSAAFALGDETAIGAALTAPTGVSATFALGSVSPAIVAAPQGVSAEFSIMGALLWSELLEFQNDTYVEVSVPSAPTWSEVSEPTAPEWADVPQG